MFVLTDSAKLFSTKLVLSTQLMMGVVLAVLWAFVNLRRDSYPIPPQMFL